MDDLEINTKVSIDFNTIKEYLEDNGFKIVTDKKHQLLNSHPELSKLNHNAPRTWVEDPRYLSWCDEESTRGFADFELWSLDVTMVELLYERLVGFDLLDGWSTGDDQRDNILKKVYIEMLNLCKQFLKDDEPIADIDKNFKKIWKLWADYGLNFWD